MPTWLLYRLIRKWLPRDHLLKEAISLAGWKQCQTPLCRQFDFTFRLIGIAILAVIVIYMLR